MKKLLSMIGIALLMASCTEDYTDWAAPITNSPEEPLGIGITASPAAAVDFATYTAEKVQLFTAAVTGLDGGKATYGAEITNEDGSKSIAIEVDDNFMADRDELESAIYTLWGRRPETRTIPVNVVGLIELNKMTIAATAKTTFTATPDAPEIAENYYIVGGTKDWAQSAASKEQKFNHSSKDVYEDPVFTIVIDANEEGDTWFAIGDDKACDAITNESNWSLLFGTKLGNGKNGTSGSLDRRTKLSDDGSFCVPAGQRKIRVTINMMEYTYEISTLDFGEFFYEIGNESGWAASHELFGGNGDGKYQGFYYLDGEFKFKPNADNWDDDLEYVDGTTMGGTLTSSGGPNCPDPGAGFYRIDLDASNLSYTLKKIEYVSIIGTANGNWDTDTDLTYNKEEGCWEVTTDLNAGEMKFRGNHNWDGDVDLGGSLDNLVHGGANIPVEAGNYTIRLFISIAGNHYCIMNKN